MRIAISKIKENPNNPRHVFDQAEDDSLAASMQKQGQLVACVVRQAASDSFQLISGARRLRAAKKNGWPELECVIEDKSEGDEAIELMVYNGGKKLFWLEEYEGIEYARSKNPGMTQQELADRLEVTQQKVSCVQKALSLLNKSAREAIYRNPVKSDNWMVTEAAVLALIKLANGQPDDQDGVEQALRVVLDRRMTEKQVKKLIAWIKKGNSPETFPQDGKLSGVKGAKQQNFDPNDQYADLWQPLPKNVAIHKTSKGYRITMNVSEAEAPGIVYGAMAFRESLDQKLNGQGSNGNNKYSEALPGLREKAAERIKACNMPGAPCDGDGSEPGTRNQKLETSGNSGNAPMTLLNGILNQKVISTSADPVDQIKAEMLNNGADLLKKGVKKLWDHFNK